MKRLIISLIISFGIAISIGDARILNVPEDYQTIQAGIDSSQNGDTVLVQPGRYMYINFNGHMVTVGSLFLTTGDQTYIDSTVIDAERHPVSVVRFNSREDSTARLTGFVLTGGSGSLDIMQDTSGGGIHCFGASPTLDNLKIIENSAEYGGGIFLQNSSPNIENILIEGNTASILGGGMYCSRESSPTVSKVVFSRNQCSQGSAFSMFNWCNPVIRNSTFVNNLGASAIRSFWGQKISLVNCIISGNDLDSIYFTGDPVGYDTLDISYSLLRGGQAMISILDSSTQGVIWGNGNIDADPLFLDPNNGDYRLSADSPCIDAGDPDSPLDPDGTRADMGAFYFHQRDIEVEPQQVVFPPTPWDSISAIPVVITNTGGNDLHLTDIMLPMHSSFITFDWDWSPEEPVTILPDSSLTTWAIFHPQREGEGQAMPFTSWVIVCDDPDEPEVLVGASGEILSVSSDILHSSLFTLHSAYPNPFNSATTIRFALPGFGEAGLRVYDLSGRLVEDLLGSTGVSAGRGIHPVAEDGATEHSVVWNAEGIPGGIYLIRLENGSQMKTSKVVLLK